MAVMWAAYQKKLEAKQCVPNALKELQEAHAQHQKIAIELSDIKTRKELYAQAKEK